jgi:tetraacyldisaccharide 4'-kinase
MKVPVVVVGNLTVGGTGKTPLVAWLSGKLAAVGLRVAIVSRGYGGRARGVTRVTLHSRPSEVGDEPLLLARRAQATVFVGRDRVAAARQAVADGADILLCDDGLQHLALMRDCEIVVIDGQRGFGNGSLLPRGPLRESPRRLRRVNAVVVNGALKSGFKLPKFVAGTHFVMNMRPGDARPVSGGGGLRALASFRGSGVHAVAAIGNPQRFFDMLRDAGLTIYEHPMPDHHAFRSGDLNFGDALPVLMTEKDAVKCAAFADERCWYVPVTAEFSEDQSRALIDLVIARINAFNAAAKSNG